MPAPPWLFDEAEVLALLHAALDRFDQYSATERQRPTWIAIEKYLPTLARMDADADQLWRFIKELAQLQVLRLRLSQRGTYDAEWVGARVAFDAQSECTLREWLNRPAAKSPMVEWREAVLAHATCFEHGVDALLERRIVIPGRRAEDVVRALASLREVSVAATLRQLSAHAFWGDSKVLDDRGDLIAALFPRLVIRDRPIVVAVHLPLELSGVLFIENQDTYTAAMDGWPPEARNLALVYLAGFKGAAERIRTRAGARLHFAGAIESAMRFSQWWFDGISDPGPVYFWGDLDFSAMHMLKSLRQRFPNVDAWRYGYEPMLATVATGGRLTASESWQVDPGITGVPYADEVLLPAIRQLGFLDQERIETPIAR